MSQSVNEYLTLSQGISTAVIPQWIKTVDKTLEVPPCLKSSLLCVGKYQMGFEVLFLSIVLQKFKCRLLTFATFVILKIDNILVPFRVNDWRGKGSDSLIFQLDCINDEAAAQRLIGTEAYMLISDMTEDEELQPTWQSLVGYRVVDTDQGELGVVTIVDETTINTLITLDNGRMIPIHEDFIVDILPEKKELKICLPFLFTKD